VLAHELVPRAGFPHAPRAGRRSVRIDKDLWGAIPLLINCDKNAVAGRVLPQIFVFQVNRCDLRGARWHGSEGEPAIRHRCRETSSSPLAEGPPQLRGQATTPPSAQTDRLPDPLDRERAQAPVSGHSEIDG
jgi:hypothetical protein